MKLKALVVAVSVAGTLILTGNPASAHLSCGAIAYSPYRPQYTNDIIGKGKGECNVVASNINVAITLQRDGFLGFWDNLDKKINDCPNASSCDGLPAQTNCTAIADIYRTISDVLAQYSTPTHGAETDDDTDTSDTEYFDCPATIPTPPPAGQTP